MLSYSCSNLCFMVGYKLHVLTKSVEVVDSFYAALVEEIL